MIGATVSHYRILEKLGEGGMGEVFLAEDTRLERRVALKFLPPHVVRDKQALKRFEQEAKATAAIHHPNIVTIHEIGVHDGRHFIAMAYIDGTELSDLIATKGITIEQATEITLALCDALGEAHKKGIVHRDLKPANIIVDSRGQPHILDFGLALKSGATRLTREDTTVGSLHYMSPEQTTGSDVDGRTDIFSLGAILYEMIAGRPAFPGDHAAAVQYAINNENPQPLARYNNQATAELERIVAKALAKDRELRYQTMGDLAADLKALRAREKAATRSAWQQFKRAPAVLLAFLRKPAVVSGLLVGALGFLIGLKVAGGDDASSPGPRSGNARYARLAIPVPPDKSVVPLPETTSVAVSPDGEYVVYVGSGGGGARLGTGVNRSDRAQLYVRLLDNLEIAALDGTEGASAPFISPDSRWIGFLDVDNGTIKKVSRNGGVSITICEGISENLRGLSWGDDGYIYFAEIAGGIERIAENGGVPETIAAPSHDRGEKTYRFPQLLPGTRTLLFTLGTAEIDSYDEADIALYDLDTGAVRRLLQGGTYPRYSPTGHIVYARAGKLFAVPFDIESLETTGVSSEVLGNVITSDGFGSAQFSFSNDGTLVYVSGGPEQYTYDLFFVDRDGTIEKIPQQPRSYGNVAVSSDGGRLALSVLGANATVWIYDLSRGTMTRLIGGWDNHSPVWSPDDSRLAFGSNREGVEGLWNVSSDGSGGPAKISGGAQYPSTWSSDGAWIAGTIVSPGTGSDIWVFRADGSSSPEMIIAGPNQEFAPAFCPDGRWIAYGSDESGRAEIYVQPFPTTGQRWKISEDGGDTPVWSRDGTELYFWHNESLMVSAIDREPAFRPSKERVLVTTDITDVHDFDVLPGGDRFVVIGRFARGGKGRKTVLRPMRVQQRYYPALDPNISVVTNWFSLMPSAR